MKLKLGNIVEFFTTITGIRWLWKKIKKGDCSSCQRRKDKLNNLFEK
jgi:hypothetical protein